MRASAFLLAGLVSCGTPTPALRVDSGIEGRVTVGPSCPVVRAGEPCPDRPLQALVLVRRPNGDLVTRFRSAPDGTFRVLLDPGRYVLDPQSPNRAGLPSAGPVDVTVAAGSFTHVEIPYDSGIR